MMEFLMGVPSKLNTLLNRLTADRATKLDNLNAALTTLAPANTALLRATWTDEKAAFLDAAVTTIGGKLKCATYSTAGADQFVVPANVTCLWITMVGGGGGGGGSSNTAGWSGGCGGGSGQAIVRWPYKVTAGATLNLTVGAAGTAGAIAGAGGAGGSTIFDALTVYGGAGGGAATNGLAYGGAGGGAANGADTTALGFYHPGAAGANSTTDSHNLGFNGGAAALNPGGSGGDSLNNDGRAGGGGGSSVLGRGGTGGNSANSSSTTAGAVGTGYGSGGGGAGGAGSTNYGRVGGAGTAGFILVEWIG